VSKGNLDEDLQRSRLLAVISMNVFLGLADDYVTAN
jgi:hypothetical protein